MLGLRVMFIKCKLSDDVESKRYLTGCKIPVCLAIFGRSFYIASLKDLETCC
jgi:hypothetical protein